MSRFDAQQRAEVAEAVAPLAGAEAAAAVRAGVADEIMVRGVAPLAAMSNLREALRLGLSDHHDATNNFLWRLGTAAADDATLDAVDPLALLRRVPALRNGEAPLELLLVHGVADVDVPVGLSLALAEELWESSSPGPRGFAQSVGVRLLLLPGGDHYHVAGMVDTSKPEAGAIWDVVCSGLRAFVAGDGAALAAVCCSSPEEARALCALAPRPTCVAATADGLLGSAADNELVRRCNVEPEFVCALTRGLRRWVAWGWTDDVPVDKLNVWLRGCEENAAVREAAAAVCEAAA